MQNVSSHGRAQHSAKSINLEANILAEWVDTTSKIQRQIRLRALILTGIIVVACSVIPSLQSTSSDLALMAAAAKARHSRASLATAQLAQKTKAAQPLERASKVLAASRTNLEVLLGNLTLVINAAPTSVVFNNIEAQVTDAQLTITCKSEAESDEAGQAFTAAASKGPNVGYAVQASTMKSEVLSKTGLAFDFIKRVNLEP